LKTAAGAARRNFHLLDMRGGLWNLGRDPVAQFFAVIGTY
jgi:hypothetical protein